MTEHDEGVWDRDLKAGLREAFGRSEALRRDSVLAQIREWSGLTPRILLREPDADSAPLVPEAGAERYRVLSEIARGGVGIVLQGRDVDLGRDVAMKVIRPEHARSSEILRRFVEEAQIGGQLQHPGIVPVYELGLDEERRVFFTMKLIRGKTLADLLEARKDLGEARRRFLTVFEQVCQTVAYAHARGVVHRDLKPANVMVGSFGEVQVVDWGFAKVLGREEPSAEEAEGEADEPVRTVRSGSEGGGSQAGSVMGTPGYMPPEQALGRVSEVDARSDVFALGGILLTILTGAPPYTKEGMDQILSAARGELEDAYARLDACEADAELVDLARRCLSKEMADRPADAKAVADRVTSYLASVEDRARKAEVSAAQAEVRARGERKARKLTLALAASVLLALLLGSGGLYWAEAKERERTEQASRVVRGVMEEARGLQGEARRDRGLWPRAVKAAAKAVALAEEQQAGAEIEKDARRLLAELEAGAARAARNAALVAELSEVRAKRGDTLNLLAADRAYGRAFASFVIDGDPAEAAARIRATGIGDELSAFLDDWTWLKGIAELPADHLVAVAESLDPDEWRSRLRRAAASEDRAGLLALVDGLAEEDLASGNLPNLLALHLSHGGMHERAVEVLREAQRLRPGDFWVNYQLGFELTLLVPPAWEEGIGFFRVALAENPDGVEVRHQLGIALVKSERCAEAIRVFEDLLGAHPDYLHACDHLIEAHERNGTLDDLVREWERSPATWRDHYRFGRALEVVGDWERVIEAYGAALRLEPSPFLHSRLGLAHQYAGDVDAAIESHRAALDLDPEYAEAHGGIARALFQRDELPDALEANERARAIDPYRPLYWNARGAILHQMGNLEGALEAFAQAVRVKPDFARGYAALGAVEKSRGNLPASIDLYERSVLLPERFAEGRFEPVYEIRPDPVTRRRVRRAVLGRHRGKSLMYANLGDAYERKGDLAAAVRCFRRHLELWPERWQGRVRMMTTLWRMGDMAAVVDEGRKVLAVRPDDEDVSFHLCSAYLALGEVEEARTWIRRLGPTTGDAETRWLEEWEAAIALAGELPAILAGEKEWSSPRERVLAAWMCHEQARYATAVQLYEEAFRADPALASDSLPWPVHRYRREDAAQAAIMASRGLGRDGADTDAEERARLRALALEWMREDLAAWVAGVAAGDERLRGEFRPHLRELLSRHVPGLVRIRSNLEELPPVERAAWESFWTEVRERLRRR